MEQKELPLSSLQEGDWAIVTQLALNEAMSCRLEVLGFINGTKIRCRQKSPAGDPVVYELRGTAIALRNRDADKILVRLEGAYDPGDAAKETAR